MYWMSENSCHNFHSRQYYIWKWTRLLDIQSVIKLLKITAEGSDLWIRIIKKGLRLFKIRIRTWKRMRIRLCAGKKCGSGARSPWPGPSSLLYTYVNAARTFRLDCSTWSHYYNALNLYFCIDYAFNQGLESSSLNLFVLHSLNHPITHSLIHSNTLY